MADIDLKAATPDTSLPSTGFLFGADSQAAASPSVYSVQTVATALLGSSSLTGATETTSKPILDLAQTWNSVGTTFTGLKFNVTDTASASGSLLMDLQVGGSSKFYVGKTGRTNVQDLNCWDGDLLIYRTGTASARLGTTQLSIAGSLALSTGGSGVSSPDLYLTRKAAASLRLGAADAAAPVAQTLSVQSVVAGTTDTAGANFVIAGSQGTGTGAGGSIVFQVAPAGTAGSAQNALATALTIGADRNATFARNLRVGADVGTLSHQVDGPNQGFMGSSGNLLAVTGAGKGFGISTDGVTSADCFLFRDAANTLAQRNGTTAQVLRVYNTFTNSTNYERANFEWAGNVFYLGTAAEGTGTRRKFSLSANSVEFVTGSGTGTPRWEFNASGHLVALTDNSFDIGASGANRPRNIYAGTSITGPHNMTGTAPASATATGTAGDVRYDADYIYVCTAANTWKRAAIATW